MATIPHIQHFRHRLYSRLRYGRKMKAFLAAEATALASTASGQTVSPKRTTNTKAEALIVFGGQPSNGHTLKIGNTTYTFKTALTEAKAAGTLTNDGTNITAADTVTVDGHVYTFKDALTEAKATGLFTFTSQPADTDYVTIGAHRYTFKATLSGAADEVLRGASAAAAHTNLIAAINGSAGAGSTYGTGTVANTQVTAADSSGNVAVTAKAVGTAGNLALTSKVGAGTDSAAVTTANMTGGVNSIANEVLKGASNTASMTNLFEAINAGSNGGTDYASATAAHTTVVATNPTGTTVVVTSKVVGVASNLLATTEASSHLSWAHATLISGVDSIANEIVIGNAATDTRTSLLEAITAGANVGVDYSTATAAHPLVTAATATNDLLVTALLGPVFTPGKSVTISKTGTNSITFPATLDGPGWTATGHSFNDGEGPMRITNSGGALPTGTYTGDLFVHKIDANTVAFATSLVAIERGDFLTTTSAGTGTQTAKRAADAKGIFGLLKSNAARTVAAATDIDALK